MYFFHKDLKEKQMAATYWKYREQLAILKQNPLVIVGGGVCGLSMALWAEAMGVEKIVLFEKRGVGSGASGRNAGFITSGSALYLASLREKWGDELAREIWSHSRENLGIKRQLLESSGLHFFNFHGSATLAINKNEQEQLRATFDFAKSCGFNPRMDKMQKEDVFVFDNEGSFYSYDFIQLILSKLKHTRIIDDTTVFDVKDGVLTTENGEVKAERVLFCTNTIGEAMPESWRKLVRPVRAQIQFAKTSSKLPFDYNLYIPGEKIYLRPVEGGVIIGGLRVLDPQNEETADEKINHTIQNALTKKLSDLFGIVPDEVHAWSGIMAYTQDELPIYLQKDNVHFLGGFSGHGNGHAYKLTRDVLGHILKGHSLPQWLLRAQKY
jgi:gamma-glutamylputrescine oxidase